MGEETIQAGDRERDEAGSAPSVMVSVTILEQKGKSALIAWDNKRGYIPLKAIVDGAVDEAVLDAAIPYGIAWEELIDLSYITPQVVGDALRKANVWTADDLHTRGKYARQAMNRLMGDALAALRRTAKQIEEV